jgi:hypothetical protein
MKYLEQTAPETLKQQLNYKQNESVIAPLKFPP